MFFEIVCGGVKCPEGSTGCSMSSSQVNDEKKCSIKCFDKKGNKNFNTKCSYSLDSIGY